MREIVLGTAGHVDHGKTSLVKALTGIDTDRLKEEKKRGITIELGFAYLDLPSGRRLGIVDVPGHEKFIKNMVAGVGGIDLLAFVIAADEGIMPQTKEHFDICRLLGVKQGVIVITKTDLVEEDWLEMVEDEVLDFCQDSYLEDAPLIRVSATKGEGLDELIKFLDDFVSSQELEEARGPFRLPVDRVFAMKGFGTVITGTSISGRTAVGEDLRFYPLDRDAKVRGIQVHGETVPEVEAGHRTAINFQGVDTDRIERGMVVATPGCLEPNYMLDCTFLLLRSNTKPLKHRARVRVHFGTSEIMARISLLDRDELTPGQEAPVQLLLESPVAVWPQDHYVVRSYSPMVTIGGGTILGNVSPRKRKRLTQKDRDYNSHVYKTLLEGDTQDKILLYLKESGSGGLCFDELAVRLGVFSKQLDKLLMAPLSSRQIVVIDSAAKRYMAAEFDEQISQTIQEHLEKYHQENPLKTGLSKEELRSEIGVRIDNKAFLFSLNNLLKKKTVIQEESLVRLASHQVALQADEKELQKELTEWYRNRGLATATIKETREHFAHYPDRLVKEVLALLLHEQQLVKVSETLYFHSQVLEQLGLDMTKFIQKEGEIDAPRFKDLTGLTRKYSIPLLEYFDRIKLTIRIGDKRKLRKTL